MPTIDPSALRTIELIYNIPNLGVGTIDGIQSVVDNRRAGAGGTKVVTYSAQQEAFIKQAYGALIESAYGALALQTRFGIGHLYEVDRRRCVVRFELKANTTESLSTSMTNRMPSPHLRIFIIWFVMFQITILVLSSFFVAGNSAQSSAIVAAIDGFSRSHMQLAVDSSRGSAHEVAIRVTFLLAFAFGICSGVALAITVRRYRPNLLFLNRRVNGVSPVFGVLVALLLLAIPFLPLIPYSSVHRFSWWDEGIRNSREILCVTTVLSYLTYTVALFGLLLKMTNSKLGSEK